MRNLLILLLALALPGAAVAEERSMRVEGLPILILYDEANPRVADKVASVASDAAPRLLAELGLDAMAPIRIVLVSDMDAFRREGNVRLPTWGIAFALMDNQVMLVDVMRATGAMNRLEKVIPHELSHLLVAQRVNGNTLPIWFVEGLAMWQAREWSLLEHWRLMEAVWGRRAPTLWQIRAGLPREEALVRDAYRVAYIGFTERFQDRMERLPEFLSQIVGAGDFTAAFEAFWGETELAYSERVGRDLHARYHTGLLLFQTGPLFTIVAILFVFVVLRIYIRNRLKLRRMEDGDQWPESP